MSAETERQRDQRIGDALRAERAAAAGRASRRAADLRADFCSTHGAGWADGCDACRDDLGELAEVLA